jgi:Tfp pilus assembly protein PilV
MSNDRCAGFTYIEVVVASSLLLVSFLALAGMFVTGYAQVSGAGNTTMGLAAARQLLEDARRLPFADLADLDGFDTEDPLTLPADNPAREVARRWRYALAGEGVGWTFTNDERARWPTLELQGGDLDAAGRVEVGAVSATVMEVHVSISVPGRWRPLEVATFIADL